MACSDTDEEMSDCIHKLTSNQEPSSCHSSPSQTASQTEFMEGACSRAHMTGVAEEGAGPSTHGTRKIGRPVAYQGDPDSSSLTALERVQIKRRIINRESARRLRVRRQESLDVIQAEVARLGAHNAGVKQSLSARRHQQRQCVAQLADAEEEWGQANADSLQLAAQVQSLRSSVHAGMTTLQRCHESRTDSPGSCKDSPEWSPPPPEREAGYTEKWEEAPATVEGRSQSWPACDTCSPVTEGHRQIDSAMKFSSHRAPFSMGSHGCNTSIRDMLMQPSFKSGSGDSVYNITANANKAVPAPSHYSWIGRQPTTLAGNQHATHDNTHDSINIWQQPDQASAPATSSQLNSQNWTAEPHMGNSGQHVASLMSHVGSKSHMGSRSRHMGISDDMNGFKQSRDETKQLSDMHSRQLNTQLPQLSSERRYAVATDSNMKLSAQHDPQLHSQPSSTSHVGVHVDDSPLGLRAQSDSQLGAQVNNQSLAQPYVSQLSFERYASSQNLSTDGSQSNAQPPMHQMSSFPQTGNHGLAEDVKTELNTHLRNGLPTPMLQPGCEYLNDAEALL